MAKLNTKINFTDNLGITSEVTDCIEASVNLGDNIKNNYLEVKLLNPVVDVATTSPVTFRHKWVDPGTEQIIFKAVKSEKGLVIPEEVLELYATYSTLDPTVEIQSPDNLLFIGYINEVGIENATGGNTIKVKSMDRSEVILNKLSRPQAYTATNSFNSPKIIQQVVRTSSENSNSQTSFDSSGNKGSNLTYLIDARLFSEGIKSSGTATSLTTNKLIDSGATFVTDGVAVDDWVRDTVTNDYAYVVSVDSETQLTITKDIFTSTDGYQVSDGFIQDTRSDVVASGTTSNTTTNKLVAAGENFDTTVAAGDAVFNLTDGTYAKVTAVDSSTTLSLDTDIFTSGEEYTISSSFPLINYSVIDQPVTEIINELSQPEYTNSATEVTLNTLVVKRGAKLYIDKKGRFHWYVPSDTPDFYMEVGATTAVSPDTRFHKLQDVDLMSKVEGNVNFIIYKAGEDMNNIQIKGYDRPQFSGSPLQKDSFRDYSIIARTMKQYALQQGEITQVKSDEYDYPASYNPLPTTSDYPVWLSPALQVSANIPTSDSEYNALFIQQANIFAKTKTQAEFDLLSEPKWKGKIQLRGAEFIVGDLINFTSIRHGVVDLKLRIKQVTHSFSAVAGWVTSLNVEQEDTKRG